MKNNRQKVMLLLILLLGMMFVLASCSVKAVDMDSYILEGEGNLNFVAKIAMAMHKWIGEYGWTVILFTIFLKIVTLPLDIWQRYSMRKQSLKMQAIQPLMQAIDKRYGANSDKARMEKQKIQQKQSASALASCLPMIVTMLIMIFMFNGLRDYATFQNVHNYHKLESFYNYCYETAQTDLIVDQAYDIASKATENPYTSSIDKFRMEVASKGLKNVHPSLQQADRGIYIGIADFYLYGGEYEYKGEEVQTGAIKESFLWIQSIWQPDNWSEIMPTYDVFSRTVSLSGQRPAEMYNVIREQVLTTATRSWNGLLLFPIASVGIMLLSMFMTQSMDRKNRKGEVVEQDPQQMMSSRMNMFLMPIIFGVFGLFYTGAVAVYITTSYLFGILVTLAIKPVIERMVEKSVEKAEAQSNVPKANYKR